MRSISITRYCWSGGLCMLHFTGVSDGSSDTSTYKALYGSGINSWLWLELSLNYYQTKDHHTLELNTYLHFLECQSHTLNLGKIHFTWVCFHYLHWLIVLFSSLYEMFKEISGSENITHDVWDSTWVECRGPAKACELTVSPQLP